MRGGPGEIAAVKGVRPVRACRYGAVVTDDQRRPRSVYSVGDEPEVQASLANERTALSWIRTGMTLVAGGVALATLSTFGEMPLVILAIAGLASLGGVSVGAWALISWRRTERALRRGQPLPAPSVLPWLVAGVVVVGLLLAGVTAFQAIELTR